MGVKPLYAAAGLALAAGLAGIGAPGPARAADAALIAAALQEKQLVWYSIQVLDQVERPMAEAFEKKYPGIKVQYTQSAPPELVSRVINEAKANRRLGDIADGPTSVTTLKAAGLLAKYLPDSAKGYAPELRDPEGYWVATNVTVTMPAYNTKLVPPGTEPKTLQDLLDPKWRGQIAWSTQVGIPTSAGFVGMVLKEMGQEKGMTYLKELQKQKVANLPVAARQVLDQVISGEYKIGLAIYSQNVQFSIDQGAPVKWINMEPVVTSPSVVAIIADSPHPNAAKLFEDFELSEEGQKIFQKGGYIPAHPNVPALVADMKPEVSKARALNIPPEQGVRESLSWKKTFDEIFQ